MIKIGDKIRIISMKDEPQYKDKEGVVTHRYQISTAFLSDIGLGFHAQKRQKQRGNRAKSKQ